MSATPSDVEDHLDRRQPDRESSLSRPKFGRTYVRPDLLATDIAFATLGDMSSAAVVEDGSSAAYDWTGLADESSEQLPKGFVVDVRRSPVRQDKKSTCRLQEEASCSDDISRGAVADFNASVEPEAGVSSDHEPEWTTSYDPSEDTEEWSDSSVDDLDFGEWSLDDYDGLDEEELGQSVDTTPAPQTRITRELRAAQQASIFAREYALDERMQDLVADAFSEWGWNATKRALARQVSQGLTTSELQLAITLRRLWASDESLWASDPWSHERKALSWCAAVAIGRAFNAYPDVEEVEVWVQCMRDRWGSSAAMRREYLSFHAYVAQATCSPFNLWMVCPGASLVDAGFHDHYEDDFSCGSYSGEPPVAIRYERAFSEAGQRW